MKRLFAITLVGTKLFLLGCVAFMGTVLASPVPCHAEAANDNFCEACQTALEAWEQVFALEDLELKLVLGSKINFVYSAPSLIFSNTERAEITFTRPPPLWVQTGVEYFTNTIRLRV